MGFDGVTTSRLNELRTYRTESNISEFGDKYVKYDPDIEPKNGYVAGSVLMGEIVYYVNDIKYKDIYDEDGNFIITHFYLEPKEMDVNEDGYLIKNNKYGNSVDKPRIYLDVFVDRNEKTAFKDNRILSDLTSLLEVTTFAGGNYFNIIKI